MDPNICKSQNKWKTVRSLRSLLTIRRFSNQGASGSEKLDVTRSTQFWDQNWQANHKEHVSPCQDKKAWLCKFSLALPYQYFEEIPVAGTIISRLLIAILLTGLTTWFKINRLIIIIMLYMEHYVTNLERNFCNKYNTYTKSYLKVCYSR